MIRGTTPDFILTLDGVDLTGKTLYVTISQQGRKITKTGDDLEVTVTETQTQSETVYTSEIAFSLTQEETLGLVVGSASVQVRYIDSDGKAEASDIAVLSVDKVLLEKVIEYADGTS